MRRLFACIALLLLPLAARAETHDELVARLKKVQGVIAVVNLREDKSFGSIAVGIPTAVMADRGKAEQILDSLGRHAVENRLRVQVLGPSKVEVDYAVEKIKATGVDAVTTRTMEDWVSIKTTRIFLSPMPAKAAN